VHCAEQERDGGVRRVIELIEKVSGKFGDYLAELGWVTFSRTDEADFKSYGVAIEVVFGANTISKLHKLDLKNSQIQFSGAFPCGRGLERADEGSAERRGDECHHGSLILILGSEP
jgi:hypothetical protein